MLTLNEDYEENIIPSEEEIKNAALSLLGSLIKAQWDMVDQYNSTIASLEFAGLSDYSEHLKDLVADETANIGILEGILQDVEPSYLIDQGKEEIEKKLD